MDDDVILTRMLVGGRPYWQTAEGRRFPVISGGADDGGDTGETGEKGAAEKGAAENGAAGEKGAGEKTAGGGGEAETVTVTQADLDALLEKRLIKARKAWEAEAATAAERAKLDEVELLKAEKADAEKARLDAERGALAVRVETVAERAALAAGVRAERVERFMRLVDLTDLDALVEDGKPDSAAIGTLVAKALDDVPEFKAPPAAGRSGAEFTNHDGQPKTLEEAVNRRIAAQTGS